MGCRLWVQHRDPCCAGGKSQGLYSGGPLAPGALGSTLLWMGPQCLDGSPPWLSLNILTSKGGALESSSWLLKPCPLRPQAMNLTLD